MHRKGVTQKTVLLTLAACLLARATALTAASGPYFTRLASFAVDLNVPEDADPATETSAEIITATPDDRTLVYGDSPLGVIGMIDISDRADPKPAGIVALDGVGVPDCASLVKATPPASRRSRPPTRSPSSSP